VSETPVKYSRLGPRARRAQGFISMARIKNSLWLGPDHLMNVERAWMNEEYKRFYFRDIQAITIQGTDGAAIWNWIFGSLAAASAGLFGFLAWRSDTPVAQKAWLITGGIISAVCLVRLLLNWLRGPTCICRLRTAVQTVELPSLGRTKAARQALARLEPLLAQTQGLLSAEAIGRLVSGPAETPAPAPHPARPPSPVLPPASGEVHEALFGALILDAAVGLFKHIQPVWHSYFMLSSALLILVSGLGLTAIVRQHDTAISAGVRRLTVIACTGVLAILFGIFIYGFADRTMYTIRHPGQFPSHIDFYALWGFKEISLGVDIVELALGVAGLAMTLAYRRRLATHPPPSAGATKSPERPALTP
jgi:hypothetical protein